MGRSRKTTTPPRKSLADALFSSTKQRVLLLLFGQPERRFFASELITLADKGSGSVQRELAVLTESGLVEITPIGRQKFYQANKKSPIFLELQSILTKTVGLVSPLRKALEKRKDIDHAFIYGSVAKGSDHAASDIDLFVISETLSLAELYELLEPVEKSIERKISCTLYTLDEFERKRVAENPFVLKVMRGETIPIIGDQSVLARET